MNALGAIPAIQFNVGTNSGLAFDGANIWTASDNSNTVTKLRASDGAVLGIFNAEYIRCP
jgi:hypothetical protein